MRLSILQNLFLTKRQNLMDILPFEQTLIDLIPGDAKGLLACRRAQVQTLVDLIRGIE